MDDMEHVFTMEEILGPFWDDLPPLPPLEQPDLLTGTGSVFTDAAVVSHGGDGEGSSSHMMDQWTFEGLLEEEDLLTNPTMVPNCSCPALNLDPVVEVNHGTMVSNSSCPALNLDPVVEVNHGTMDHAAVSDPMEYNAILKRKLEEDLEAFKMWKASGVVNSDCSQGSKNQNEGSKDLVQNKPNGEDPTNNHAQNADLRVKLATSSSSKDPTPSEEDMDGDVEVLGFKMPTEERLRKRKESNRESARRSRYRKAAHLKDLEDQVEHLKAENSSLLRRLAALNTKYNDANVDNRVLRADIETLRAKVKMGEDSLKRAKEKNALPSIPISELPGASSVPIQDDMINYFTGPGDNALVDNSFMPMPDPLHLQAEEQTISGTLNNTTEINPIAATHGAYAGDNGSHADLPTVQIYSAGI